MTHAWQFAAHPWLRGHMEQSMRVLLDTVTQKASPAVRIAAFAGVLPAQWRVMRQMQGTMSLIEGYSNLVMNELGARLLPGFDGARGGLPRGAARTRACSTSSSGSSPAST